MRPYLTRRLTEGPDMADIRSEGRASHIGRIKKEDGEYRSSIHKAANRKATRRNLKRADKARQKKQEEAE